jgi:quinol monooxygenase YgiN
MSDAVTVIATLRAAKGKADALRALLAEQAAAVRAAEPDCAMYRVHQAADDPELFVFYEIYADQAAFDAHRTAPHVAAFRARRQAEGLVAGPVDMQVVRPISE